MNNKLGFEAVIRRVTLGILEVILNKGMEKVLDEFRNLSDEEKRDFPNVRKAVENKA